MTTPEFLVPTLTTCRALKAAGFSQDTHFHWVSPLRVAPFVREATETERQDGWSFSAPAPTLSEVLAQLPVVIPGRDAWYLHINHKHRFNEDGGLDLLGWWIRYHRKDFGGVLASETHANAAEAAALLYLALHEAGHPLPPHTPTHAPC